MIYQQEEKRTGVDKHLGREATALALEGRWEEAVAVNKRIVERFPNDVATYNRLGRALTELGKFGQAREAYGKALEIAPGNTIALKNLARLARLSESQTGENSKYHKMASGLFLTEIGRAAVVSLSNLAPWDVLARMGLGAQVYLKVEGQHLAIRNERGEYLGEVEPKYGLRLIKLMRGGNEYAAAILSIEEERVQVIIREKYQHPSQAGYLSFPPAASRHLPVYAAEASPAHDIAAELEHEESAYPNEEGGSLLDGFSILEGTADEGGTRE